MNLLVNSLLCALFGSLSIPAMGAETEAVSARVVFSDLDLGRPGDVALLEHRVNRAVKSVCATGGRTLSETTRERACIRTASAAAGAQVFRVTGGAAGRPLDAGRQSPALKQSAGSQRSIIRQGPAQRELGSTRQSPSQRQEMIERQAAPVRTSPSSWRVRFDHERMAPSQ